MEMAFDGFATVCETMFMVSVERSGDVRKFDAAGMAYGGCISLMRDDGVWDMALFGGQDACLGLSRAIFAMEDDETPTPEEVTDALGELINMVSGSLRKDIGSAGASSQGSAGTSVPLFLEGEKETLQYATREIEQRAIAVVSEGYEGEIFLVWTERSSRALLRELASALGSTSADDSWGLTQILSLFQELEESFPENADDSLRETADECMSLLTDVINESVANPAGSLNSLEATVTSLVHAIAQDRPSAHIVKPVAPPAEEAKPLASAAKVERDEDDLELYAEFLEEACEGLDRCDEILMDVEGGASDPQVITEYVAELFRIYHSTKGVASCSELDDIAEVGHSTEEVLSEVRDGKLKFEAHVVDIVFESTALMRRLVDIVREAVEASVEFIRDPAVPALIEKLNVVHKGGVPEGLANAADPVEAAPAAPKVDKPKAKLKETVKVDMELLNALDEMLNRLRTVEDAITSDEIILQEAGEQTLAAIDELPGVAQGLFEISTKLRMVTMKPVFQKMSRLVRDLSKKTQKMVRLNLEGEDTRIDRKMVEKVGAPLVHMVRNAIDHGIEGADDRKAANKTPLGQIGLAAYHEGENMIVAISDDGKGLDPEILLAKALKQNLIETADGMTEQEVFHLIFHPGFSTAAAVTDISGRGVGMDVVKQDISSMGGHVDIESKVGAGSVFKIVLPLISGK